MSTSVKDSEGVREEDICMMTIMTYGEDMREKTENIFIYSCHRGLMYHFN